MWFPRPLGRRCSMWLRVSPFHIRHLSLNMLIPKSRVASRLEQCVLAEGATELSSLAALSEIKLLAEKYRQDTKDLQEGRIRLYIPNRFTRRAIAGF